MARALALCAEHGGGRWPAPRERRATCRATLGGDAVGSWREAFLGAPYVRDVLVAMGVLAETFETAITWERFPALHERVTRGRRAGAARGVRAAGQGDLPLHPRLPGRRRRPTSPCSRPRGAGEEVEQWARDQAGRLRRDPAEGGTITHHHAVGRDHRPWYDRQRPDPFAAGAARREGSRSTPPGS